MRHNGIGKEGGVIPRYVPRDMRDLWSDQTKYATWLEIELAVLEAREKRSEIPKGTTQTIRERAWFTVEQIDELDAVLEHDMLAFIQCVRESLGDLARYFHEGMTSYDVVDTALSLLLRRAVYDYLLPRADTLRGHLVALAQAHATTLKIGRTHGQHGEPITFGFEALNWLKLVHQATTLLEDAGEVVCAGKCSGAMGTYVLNPSVESTVCDILSLHGPQVSMQALSRVPHAQLLSAIAIFGSVLDKICTDIRLGAQTEIGELEEPRKPKQKGSSAMPHKRNPVICERICGQARTLRSVAGVGLENIGFWSQNDVAHSSGERISLPDATTLLAYMLDKMSWVIKELVVHTDRMLANLRLTGGVVYSQDVKLLLAQRVQERRLDVSPDSVYEFVQRCALDPASGTLFLDRINDGVLADGTHVYTIVRRDELVALCNPWRKLQHLPTVFGRFGIQMDVPAV